MATQSVFGFALLGPIGVGDDARWQVRDLGYAMTPADRIAEVDIGTPKNLGEEYRRNIPTNYYAFDANFLDYFGSNGVAAVENAVGILNGVKNVSQYSSNLSEVPLTAIRENYQAGVLALVDLKSEALHLLVEEMGLAEPERWIWALHDRLHTGTPPCPTGMEYELVQRNFDPITFEPSSYVNDTLYSYYILEFCGTAPPPTADAVEFPVDPLSDAFTSVAGERDVWGINQGGLVVGGFYTGLTRDDIGGLRYLLAPNNINFEGAGSNTVTLVTNTTPQLLTTTNLNQFIAQSRTNNAATLSALYPGLIVLDNDTNVTFELSVTTNITAVFTTSPYAPITAPPQLMLLTNYTTNLATIYHHTYANLVTNSYSTHAVITVQTTVATNSPYAPVGTLPVTNTFSQTFATNMVTGDFYIIPTNSCEVYVLSNLFSQVQAVTNVITSSTNLNIITNFPPITNTNVVIATNSNSQFFEKSVVTYFTNHVLAYFPITCETNTVGLREGLDKITFVRANYDSLLGQFFQPITNTYTIYTVTNSAVIPQKVRRVVTAPDILFSAQDMDGTPGNDAIEYSIAARSPSFNSDLIYPNLSGPGTIEPPTLIAFNKAGRTYINLSPNAYFLEQAEASQSALEYWGSFDGSTNPPVIYPDGTSIENLLNQILIQPNPTPAAIPEGTVGSPYSVQLTASGGQLPLAWKLAAGSAGLPPGLSIADNGLIYGTPTASGIFDNIQIQLTDSANRVVTWYYSFKINP